MQSSFVYKKGTSLIVKFLNQFKSFMILVLMAAAVISGIVTASGPVSEVGKIATIQSSGFGSQGCHQEHL